MIAQLLLGSVCRATSRSCADLLHQAPRCPVRDWRSPTFCSRVLADGDTWSEIYENMAAEVDRVGTCPP